VSLDRVRAAIEHTLLKAEARPEDIDALCDEALRARFRGVCVNPTYVKRAARRLGGAGPVVVSVVGFPLGASLPETVADEARRAVDDGAREVDMVIPIGRARSGDLEAVTRSVAVVRQATPGTTLKVILETGHFDTPTPEAPTLEALCHAAVAGGADFLKTSTGFGPRGATVEDVRVLAAVAAASSGVGVKAAGGIRDLAGAVAMLDAGATRLGTSRGMALVAGARPGPGY
jgi:deoxyribose-phosphate aldolase